MKCLRTLRHPWIYSIFAFSFFLFLSVFGLSPNSYATSTSCSVSVSGTTYFTLSNVCDSSFSSLNTSNVWFFVDWTTDNVPLSVNFQYFSAGNSFTYFTFANSTTMSVYNSSFPSSFQLTPYPNYNVLSDCNGSYPCNPTSFNVSFGNAYTGTLTFSIDDSFGGSTPEPEPCPVCPVVPENPYDDKFDALTKAIYCCGAILIMLYFFFCIYKIIVKDGGSR